VYRKLEDSLYLIRTIAKLLYPFNLFQRPFLFAIGFERATMHRPSTITLAFLSLIISLTAVGQNPKHDLYVCAAVNRNYVIGSKITTTSGLHLREADKQWVHVGINDPSIFAVSFDPRDHNTFYTAALNGALRTVDGGKSWRIMTGWDITEPKDVCVDPHNPDRVYLAHPGGIAISDDRGMTWVRRERGLPDRGKYTQTIEVDRLHKGHILAGCETGIYQSRNDARSWQRTLATEETVNDVQQSPHDPEVWAAVTQSAGAYLSRNGGKSWTAMEQVPSEAALYNIAFDPTNPARLAIGSYTYGVLVSEDGGATWADRNQGLPQPHRIWRVGIDPDSGHLLASLYQVALYESSDFGKTWKQAGLEGSAINSFVFLPKTRK
jgi:hypothetical protein